MFSPGFSVLSSAQKLTFHAYFAPRESSVFVSEVLSRLAASLLSVAAAVDLIWYSTMLLPNLIYAVGKSLYLQEADFLIPWQYLQRIQNSVAPILFGSLFGIIYPIAGVSLSEPTDKHIVMGILSSNAKEKSFDTPCSPLHSLSIISDLAQARRYFHFSHGKEEIFSLEQIEALDGLFAFEKSLEMIQCLELTQNFSFLTFLNLLADRGIKSSGEFKTWAKIVALTLVPLLAFADLVVAIAVQTFFLLTGAVRLISGRGPIYTEITTNPLLHVVLLIQNSLRLVGNVLGTILRTISNHWGKRVIHLVPQPLFKLQMGALMGQIENQQNSLNEDQRFVIPIAFKNGHRDFFSLPFQNMHKTYLIVEKKEESFNLYWVNRPNVQAKVGLSASESLKQIRRMLEARFQGFSQQVGQGLTPEFAEAVKYKEIPPQGNQSNCVVSNLFATFETLDQLGGKENRDLTRNVAIRGSLGRNYQFYKNNFYPFVEPDVGDFSLTDFFEIAEEHPTEPI